MRTLRPRPLFEFLTAVLQGESCEPPLGLHDPALWHAALPFADRHGVALALPQALQALSIWEKLPGDVADLLTTLRAMNLERNQALESQGLEILACLDRADITAIPLKGLAYQLIGLFADDPGQRLTGDIDILVPAHAARSAQEILIAEGYVLAEGDEDHAHHLQALAPGPLMHGPCCVDVHFRLSESQEINDLLPAKAIFDGAIKIAVAGQSVTVPKTTDLLDHAVMHGGIHHFDMRYRRIRLGDALDIGRLWSKARSEGCCVSDLRISRHRGASKHFGACLLPNWASPHDLGPLEQPARRYRAQVLRLQSIPTAARLEEIENAFVANARLILASPRLFASKFFSAKPYRTMIGLIRNR